MLVLVVVVVVLVLVVVLVFSLLWAVSDTHTNTNKHTNTNTPPLPPLSPLPTHHRQPPHTAATQDDGRENVFGSLLGLHKKYNQSIRPSLCFLKMHEWISLHTQCRHTQCRQIDTQTHKHKHTITVQSRRRKAGWCTARANPRELGLFF